MQKALSEKDASFIYSKPGMPTAVFKDAAGNDPAEISLYGEIGDPFSGSDASTFGRFMRANKGKPINVRINSPGGHVYDGITIHNALVQHDAPVTTIVEGMAGSAASIIAMAGHCQIYDNANLFVHRASVVAIGNTDVMKEAADWLDKIDEGIVNTYKAKTGLPRDKIKQHMRGQTDGTIFTAKEAKALKYVDEIIPLRGSPAKALATTDIRSEADQRYRSMAFARAERIRSRAEMFTPADHITKTDGIKAATARMPTKKQPMNAGGPLYDVGDMVQVMEDGTMVGSGEVRSSMLGYMYSVRQADGTMVDDCCEDDLMPMGEE
jgi:ATP-dependent protease ClpP protease subunit